MKREYYGRCRICGKNAKLSFEHIPPRATGNNMPFKMYTGKALMNHIVDDSKPISNYDGVKYINCQKGAGIYSLCENCNNFTGLKYCPDFIDFVNKVESEFCKINKNCDEVTIMLNDIALLNVMKQIMSCLLSTCENLRIEFNDVLDYMINENNNQIDFGQAKIYIYLLREPTVYWSGKVSYFVNANGQNVAVSETDLGRIGILIDFYNNNDSGLTDITEYFKAEYNKKYNLTFKLQIKDKVSPWPNDFRKEEEID